MAAVCCLETPDDFTWLRDVHGIDVGDAELVILYGNEDAPERVEVYAENSIDCAPTVWRPDADGTLRREG